MDITIIIAKLKEEMKNLFAVKEDVPTKTSDLINDNDFATTASIPTKTSDLINDNNFISQNDVKNDLISTDTNKPLSANQGRILNDNKVNKETGKGLSTNDFTNEHKRKIDLLTVAEGDLWLSTDGNPHGGYIVFKIGSLSAVEKFSIDSGGRGALDPGLTLTIGDENGLFPNEIKNIIDTDYSNILFSNNNLSLSNTGVLKNNGTSRIATWHISYGENDTSYDEL